MRHLKKQEKGAIETVWEGPAFVCRIQKCQRGYHKWISTSLENQGTTDGNDFLMQNISKEIVPFRKKWKLCLWKVEFWHEKRNHWEGSKTESNYHGKSKKWIRDMKTEHLRSYNLSNKRLPPEASLTNRELASGYIEFTEILQPVTKR